MTTPSRTRPRRRPALRQTDRNQSATRLLASSAKHSYDPAVDIDWDEPLAPDLYGMSPEWSSLYGTRLWDGLAFEDQVRLTQHEFSSISGVGIWFEMILMQMVLRDIYDQDPATPHVQFALTEIGDECRHSVMFARMAQKYGAPSYGPGPANHRLGRWFKTLADGPMVYAGILVAEEVLDILQRDLVADERVQPLTREVSRIHVVEEARHMRFARDEVVRRIESMSRAQRVRQRAVLAVVAHIISTSLVHPDVYAAVGLDPQEAQHAARANEHYSAKLRSSAESLTGFLQDTGLIGGPSTYLWRKARLL
jgi:P-aminobenzoate N-oxygenase AurF